MKAAVGDRLVVRGSRRGDPGRSAQVLEVRGADGEPPYVVRWADGHTSVFFPGRECRGPPCLAASG
jgi:hypothetical protein